METFPGTYVYMKTGKKLKELKAHLRKEGEDVYMAENCGMENVVVTDIAKETRREYGSE